MRSIKRSMLMTSLICSSALWGGTGVFAAETLEEFTLDPLVVTATRMETRDLDTPASVEVYDEAKIERTNGANAFDILQNTLGVNTQSQGFNGTSMGTMTSRIMIRGVEKGTLVLVNGIPMNLDGKYNLEDIPAESIEKIEVVKGGGSVLYGSEATGGVINIITKKKVKNSIKVAAGNFGKERYNLTVGAGSFNIIAGLENRGYASKMSGVVGTPTASSTVYDYGKGERKSILWNLAITDGLTFTHNYSKNEHQYWQKRALSGARTQNNYYEDEDNAYLLQYDKSGWKINASYGTQEKSYEQSKFSKGAWSTKSTYSSRKGHNSNLDIQKEFDIGKDKLLIGASYQKEDMDAFVSTNSLNSTYQRDNYSIYASYDWRINDKSNLVVNARETWATGCEGVQTALNTGKTTNIKNDNMNKFTPEIEYIYKINEDSSLYAKAGKSFRLPNLTQIFGNGKINPAIDIKPEQGTHYEIGYKLNTGNSSWRFALFNYKIKDSIDADVSYDKNGNLDFVDYFNENVKNTGIELSCTVLHDNHFSSNWGIMYQNPQAQNENTYGDSSWHSIYNRYQLQGGLSYHNNKFSSNLSANFVGDRTSTRASESKPQRHLKPQLFTDLHFSYIPAENHKIFLHINNLFDRLDITSNSTANYYSLGRNFMLGYEYTF